jgi:NADH-quinone oxidoreductase subunit H
LTLASPATTADEWNAQMIDTLLSFLTLLIFPGGLFVIVVGLAYEWVHRKLLAQLQNRIGPRWFQPLADVLKLLIKEEVTPEDVNAFLFTGLPILALAGVMTSALYVPIGGVAPAFSFTGDLIVTVYLLSLLTLSLGLAGSNTRDRFSLVGATRTLTQLFAYEAPFLLALLGPATIAGSWQISEILRQNTGTWMIFAQPLGFIVVIIGLMGKLELPPFDAPEAETEIVAGALTEYSGRGLALFHLAKGAALIVGLALAGAFYLGGFANPIEFFLKTLILLGIVTGLQALLSRLRIDQTVGLWWRYGTLLVLVQWLIMIGQKVLL